MLPTGERGEQFAIACLTGPQTRPVVIESPDAQCCVLGIRLTPVDAYRVLATPLHHTTDLTLDLCDVVDRTALALAEACRAAATVQERFTRVIAWLDHRLAQSPDVHAAIAYAAQQLALQHGGALSTTALDAGYYDQAHMYADFSRSPA